MSTIRQFMLDLGDGGPKYVEFDSKHYRKFGGKSFDPVQDAERLTHQYEKVWALMADGHWRTLAQIAKTTGAPQASVSARLRDFRKPENGGHTVLSERVEGGHGLHRYRLVARGLSLE